jgi:hypothetical protein
MRHALRRFGILGLCVAAATAAASAVAGETVLEGILYKTPWCGCCAAYGDYLEQQGFQLRVVEQEDLTPLKQAHGVPEPLEGCHTLVVGDYVVEGHVPIAPLLRLLAEKPEVAGISLPGMPLGSPGMGGEKEGPFTIFAFGDGPPEVFAVE